MNRGEILSWKWYFPSVTNIKVRMVSTVSYIPRMLLYLRACFTWEYGNLGSLNLLGSGIRARHFVKLETVATGFSPTPHLSARQVSAVQQALEKYSRSSALWYGFMPLMVKNPSTGLANHDICSPLFIAQLDPGQLRSGQGAAQSPAPSLLVNQVLLSKLFSDQQAQSLASALQQIIDRAPLGKSDVAQLLRLMCEAMPELNGEGFDLFPLLQPKSSVSQNKSGEAEPRIVCAALVYLSKRSRQSMGVLHELGEMAGLAYYSAPVRQIVQGESFLYGSGGPLNVLGALSTPQRKAIIAARRHSLSVIHGPPGTGKTHVLAMLTADQLANGCSVLICARSNVAVNVIEKFLSRMLHIEGAIVRGGKTRDLRDLKARLTQILKQGYIDFSDPHPALVQVCKKDQSSEQWRLAKAVRHRGRALRKIDRRLARITRRMGHQITLDEGKAGSYLQILGWIQDALGGPRPVMYLNKLFHEWRQLHHQRSQAAIGRLQLRIQKNVVKVLRKQRKTLAKLARSLTALERNQGTLQQSIDYRVVTKTLPVWVCTLADLSHLLPLQAELFDLVIIDEASQADVASALPALQRARRAVIMGDENQLRHVSFLPYDVEADFRAGRALQDGSTPSFRADSVLDWANRQFDSSLASSFLDEHFRSSPEIIGFSNKMFYGDRLKLLTHERRPRGEAALSLVQVCDARRNKKDVNQREAAVLFDYLKTLMRKDNCPTSQRQSIGIISPFRAQADYLANQLEKEVGPDLVDKHKIIVGTAHELQGEERDIVLFSASVDDQSPGGSLVFLSRPDVLNVAITRARQRQIIFISRSVDKFGAHTLFGQYLLWIKQVEQNYHQELGKHARTDEAILAVLDEIDTRECSVSTHRQLGSVNVDILLQHGEQLLGIDLVGFGDEEVSAGLRHYELQLMYRLQLPVIPIVHGDWTMARSQVVASLNQEISAMRAGQR